MDMQARHKKWSTECRKNMNILIVFYDIETGTDEMTPYMLVFTLFYFDK